jgi:hypothetical protein
LDYIESSFCTPSESVTKKKFTLPVKFITRKLQQLLSSDRGRLNTSNIFLVLLLTLRAGYLRIRECRRT